MSKYPIHLLEYPCRLIENNDFPEKNHNPRIINSKVIKLQIEFRIDISNNTSIISAVVVVVTITGMGWWDLAGIVAVVVVRVVLLVMDGCIVELLLSCKFCSKGDCGGEIKRAVEVELFGVVGECWSLNNVEVSQVKSGELWDSKHGAEVVTAATAEAPLATVAQANDDTPEEEGPSKRLISGSLKSKN